MILGGPALFLAGHAAFKFVVWRVVSWPRLAGIAGLALLAAAAAAIRVVELPARERIARPSRIRPAVLV